MRTAADLTEPAVLARTERDLFPGETDDSYVVADTQFAQVADSTQDVWALREPVSSSN